MLKISFRSSPLIYREVKKRTLCATFRCCGHTLSITFHLHTHINLHSFVRALAQGSPLLLNNTLHYVRRIARARACVGNKKNRPATSMHWRRCGMPQVYYRTKWGVALECYLFLAPRHVCMCETLPCRATDKNHEERKAAISCVCMCKLSKQFFTCTRIHTKFEHTHKIAKYTQPLPFRGIKQTRSRKTEATVCYCARTPRTWNGIAAVVVNNNTDDDS